MPRTPWPRLFTFLVAPLFVVMFLAGVSSARAGTPYKSTTYYPSGRVTSSEHSHGGRVASGDLGQGEFYKSEASSWSKSSEKVYFQQQDGTAGAEAKDEGRVPGVPVGVTLYEKSGEVNVWKDGVEGWAGKADLALLGADGSIKGSAGKEDGNYYARGEISGKAYLAKVTLESKELGIGNENLGLHLSASGEAFVGVEGSATGEARIGKDGLTLEAKAEVFAGAKANGQIPLTLSLCKMKATGELKGEVSAGAGASASGAITVDWAKGTAKLSGELAATLGVGAGAGVDVEIDLSALVSDPGAVADCLLDGVIELAESAIELGGDLVDAAGQALSDAGSAIADAADTVGTALADGASRAADAVGSALSDAGGAIASFFGFGSDPAPPSPPVRPGYNVPLRAQTRTVVVVVVPPAARPGQPSAVTSLRAQRQAYPH
ncbi:MAG: hypothetical protein ABIO70_11235 [Pseudomonadota bacterium]